VQCYAALVDTGASCTCISKKVISDCELMSHSKITMISASGNVEANAFMFQIGIPLVPPGTTAGPSGQVFGQVNIFGNPIQGMELLNPTGRFDILLGMDILSNCSLKIEFDRHYSLCW
jgi:Aspartyl protease